MLLRFQAGIASRLFAEVQEAAELIADLRQRLVRGRCLRFSCHGRTKQFTISITAINISYYDIYHM